MLFTKCTPSRIGLLHIFSFRQSGPRIARSLLPAPVAVPARVLIRDTLKCESKICPRNVRSNHRTFCCNWNECERQTTQGS